MFLVIYYLVVVHVSPSDSQFDECLPKQFNCVVAKLRGEYSSFGSHLTESTQKVYYDEDRRMIAREESGHKDGQPFLTFRLYDYPNETLYDVVTADGKETCTKLTLEEPFRKTCMPNITQEIWLKSPLGSLPNMVPTKRFKWQDGNITTELTYTYFMQPVLLDTYGTDQFGVSLFETLWIQNITHTAASVAVFTPPPKCQDAAFQTTGQLNRRKTGFLSF